MTTLGPTKLQRFLSNQYNYNLDLETCTNILVECNSKYDNGFSEDCLLDVVENYL